LSTKVVGSEYKDKISVQDFQKLFLENEFFDIKIDSQSLGHNLADFIPKIVSELNRV